MNSHTETSKAMGASFKGPVEYAGLYPAAAFPLREGVLSGRPLDVSIVSEEPAQDLTRLTAEVSSLLRLANWGAIESRM
jgi:hypothetical protein